MTPETQEQKVERLAEKHLKEKYSADVNNVWSSVAIKDDFKTGYREGEKAGYTRAIEDREVKIASCCAENEERVNKYQRMTQILSASHLEMALEKERLQSKLEMLTELDRQHCNSLQDCNAKLDKAREGLKDGCSCRPGGSTCACCRVLKEIE